jgi:hypothetical protein
MRIDLRIFALLIVVLCAPAAAFAETMLSANLNGTQAVPGNNSTGTGFGRLTLNAAGNEVYFVLHFSGLGSNNTAVHIHGPAGPVENGPVVFSSGPTNQTSGHIITQFPVSAQQAAELKAGRWYFDAHSANFPDGEIRGQINVYAPYVAKLSASQVVPPTNSPHGGTVKMIINESGTRLSVTASLAGLDPAASAVILFTGAGPGENGDFVSQTASVPHDLLEITPQQAEKIRSGQAYITVWTANFPTGEIRGQILGSASASPDVDGDRRADLTVFRPINRTWYSLKSAGGVDYRVWGLATDIPAEADFDGDGKTDIAVWRPAPAGEAGFYIIGSDTGAIRFVPFGQAGDDPTIVGDYDGDGRADPAVYQSGVGSGQSFFFHRGTRLNPDGNTTYTPWGIGGDNAVRGDFNADGRADFAVFRPSEGRWYVRSAGDGLVSSMQFGVGGDVPVSADFDGDGQSDIAVYRPSDGIWYIHRSATGSIMYERFGLSTDTAVPADYDGDGKADVAIWRVPQHFGSALILPAYFYILGSANGFSVVNWGVGGDLPAASFQVANPGNPVN